MTTDQAKDYVADLIQRSTDEARVVGVLTIDSKGAIGVRMSADIDVDILQLGILAQTPTESILNRDLQDIRPEEIIK